MLARAAVGLVGVDQAAEEVRDLAVVVPRPWYSSRPAKCSSSRSRRARGRDLVVDRAVLVRLAGRRSATAPRRRGRGTSRPRRCRRAGRTAARARRPSRCRRPDMSTTSTSGAQAGLERAHAEQRGRARRRRAAATRRGRAGCRRDRGRGSARRLSSMGAMAVTRRTEPWTDLLEAGRADERLVREAYEGAREPRLVADARRPPSRAARQGLAARRDRRSSTPTRPRRSQAAWDGPTIVTTGTASGKSLCFNLPTLDVLCARLAKARALYLYPTKALAQDQARAINELGLRQARPARDLRRRHAARGALGDPPALEPDPHEPRHAPRRDPAQPRRVGRLLRQPRGRRRRRGPRLPRRVRLARRERPAAAAADRRRLRDRAALPARQRDDRQPGRARRAADRPRGRARSSTATARPARGAQIAMWNPPVVDEALQVRRSDARRGGRARRRARRGRARGRSASSSRARRSSSSPAGPDRARRRDRRRGAELADRVAPYRAGYTPQQRRELEARLTNGELLAVITTDALELGIDIGALDAAVCVTFPGTVASLRQMWGRAGPARARPGGLRRRRGRARPVLLPPPRRVPRAARSRRRSSGTRTSRSTSRTCSAPRTRARWTPPTPSSSGRAGEAYAELLVSQGLLVSAAAAYLLRQPEDYPAARVSLRSASPDTFAVVDVTGGELLGTVEAARAFSTVHDGAVYLHLGRSLRGPRARPRRAARARRAVRRQLVHAAEDARPTPRSSACSTAATVLGVDAAASARVTVTEQVLAYQRKRLPDHEVIDLRALDLPPQSFSTQALWYERPRRPAGRRLPARGAARRAARGRAHADRGAAAAGDVRPLGHRRPVDERPPADRRPDDLHLRRPPGRRRDHAPGLPRFETLVADAHRLIGECPCESGCPSCVQSPKCGNLNEPLEKAGALEVMARMLER